MTLQNTLYTVKSKTMTEDGATFRLSLLPECFIYKAHFPKQPITPGVCILQIAVELAEEMTGERLEMTEVKNVKFLSVMTPSKTQEVTFCLTVKASEASSLHFQAAAKTEEEVYAKLSLICKKL